MSDDNEAKYELVFEGPGDGSPDTLRRLKGTMVADLEMSVAEVQHILEAYPLTIKKSDSNHELSVACQLLKNAGGAAYIIQPKQASEQSEDAEFSMELDLDEEPTLKEPKNKVFELDLNPDEDSSLEKILSEFKEDFGLNTDTPTLPQSDLSIDDEASDSSEEKADSLSLAIDSPSEPAAEVPPPPKAESFSSSGWNLELDDGSDSPKVEAKVTTTESKTPPPPTLNFELDNEPVSAPAPKATPPTPTKATPTEDALDLGLDVDPEPVITPAPATKSAKAALTQRLVDEVHAFDKKVSAPEPESAHPGNPDPLPAVSPSTLSKKRSKKKAKLPWDVIVPIVFGVAALWVGNEYYFSMGEDPLGANAISQLVKKMESEVTSRESEEIQAPVPQDEYNIQASKSNTVSSVKWRFARTADGKLKGTFEVSTPEPRQLNKEDIANQTKRDPWLKKVDLGVINTAIDATGNFEYQTPIKAYVEDNGKVLRVSGTGSIKGKVLPDNQLQVEVVILSGIEVPPIGGKFFIERLQAGKYRFYLGTSY